MDREFSDFDNDARNIRFGFSTDGMNPFGQWGSSHSTWPVTHVQPSCLAIHEVEVHHDAGDYPSSETTWQ
jgi:hypothetical protein